MKRWIIFPLMMALLLSGCAQVPGTKENSVPEQEPPVTEQVQPSPEQTKEPTPTPTPTPTPPVVSDPVYEIEPDTKPEVIPVPEGYDYTTPVAQSEAVEDVWFEDAVFIGDSRTDGLRLYSGIKNVDIFCNKGLSVFEVIADEPVIRSADGMVGVLTALGQKQYAKVYICLGVNELGYNHDKGFSDAYHAMVDKVQLLQPEADVYLQLLVPVNTQKCKESNQRDYVNNEQIAVYNDIIRAVAAEQEVYLLDVSEVFVDETGQLPYDASFDGVHFNKDGYKTWYEYLKTHTVKEEAQ